MVYRRQKGREASIASVCMVSLLHGRWVCRLVAADVPVNSQGPENNGCWAQEDDHEYDKNHHDSGPKDFSKSGVEGHEDFDLAAGGLR